LKEEDLKYRPYRPVQRGIINLKPGKNVKAILSTADLTKIGETSVVGLSMNSSSYATSNAEAGINLEANTTVTADRTTAGNGAKKGTIHNNSRSKSLHFCLIFFKMVLLKKKR